MGYLKDTARGVFWIGSFRGITRAISLFKTILLARLLSPTQFGVFGVVALTMSLLEVVTETGVNTVLVQQKGKVYEYINSAWVVSIFRGIGIALIMVLLSGPVSLFFHIPESAHLIVLCAVIPLLRGFINPSEVNFQKDLLFKQEFIFRTVIFSIDALVSITLAILYKTPESLVWGLMAGAASELVLSHIFLNPKPHFSFHKDTIRFVIKRGKWLTVSGILDYLIQNGDNIVVGRLLGSSPLGFYQMSYQISTLPVTEISNILSKVTFPVFMKLSHDRKLLFKAYIKTVTTIGVLVGIVASVLLIFTRPFVLLVLGEKWISIVPTLQVLAVFAFFKSLVLSSYAYFLSIEKQEIVSLIPLIAFVSMFIVIIPLVNMYGMVGAALAALFGALFSLIPVVYYLLKESKK